MVQAIIDVDEHTNRILNIVKAKFGLKDKSQAIEAVAKGYEQDLLEPELRPEYVRKAKRIMATAPIKVGTTSDLRRRLGMR
ncbi:MAG: DUF2683 family protein [Nanoarchaeota archaeon]